MRYSFRKTWYLALVAGTITTILAMFVLRTLEQAETRRYQEAVRSTTLQQLSVIRGNAESAINKRVYLNSGLKAYVSRNPDLSRGEFADVAALLIQEAPGIRSITLIKDNVISDVYPLAGNEGALGLDLMKHPVQRHDVLQAMRTGKGWLSGPIKLVQGGEAFVDRVPVFVTEPNGEPGGGEYWGLVSILIDKDILLREISQHVPADLTLALSDVGSDGQHGAYFLGDSSIDLLKPLTQNIFLPNGRWQVAGVPRNGWPQESPKVAEMHHMGVLVCCLLGVFVFIIVRSCYAVRAAQQRAEAAIVSLEERDELLGETECSLAQRIEDLEKSRQATLNMMHDLEHMNQQLSQMSDSAQAANAAKSEFLANMSHEIRTPMTAILGFADMIIEEHQTGEQAVDKLEAMRTIQRNAQQLLELINDILDLSKIEAGKLTAESIPCSITALITDLESLMSVRAEAKGIDLNHRWESSLPPLIQTDPTRLRQILVNLVGNAIKFTDSGSVEIQVRYVDTDQQAPRLEFDVVDTGIGLTFQQSTRMFQPFSQADNSTTRKFGGTGLGLTISRRLAELLYGTVMLVESAPGQGSRFRLAIPVKPIAGAESAEASQPIEESAAAPQPTPSVTLQHALQNVHLLLAEDGEDNQRLIAHLLKKAGACVTVVENGKLAVDAALEAWQQDCAFDCILMDMSMPVLDGYQAATRLRAEGYQGVIIALTAHAMSGDREKCLAAGCTDFTTKPINRKKLIEQIVVAVESQLIGVTNH